ncbi:MAG TPA: hypothetical protein VNH44_07085 [Micropepsaceae bacterium]|nr:hypothetical protein [Micropepsaceae bacterium]
MDWHLSRTLVGVAAVALLLTGCNRNPAPQQPAAEQAPAATPAPVAPPPTPPPPIPPGTELPLNSVDSVMLSRPGDAPTALVIHVTGTAPSSGWTDPKLTEDAEAAANAAIKTYKLVATSPATPDEKRTPQALDAELRVESLPPEVTTIRIVSATNEISAPIAQ